MFSNRDLKNLLVPLILEQFLTGFMGIADTMMVTMVGDAAISAVSCVDQINTLMQYIFAALATGGTIVCSQYLGRKDEKGANNAARQVLLAAVVISVLLSIICVGCRSGILHLVFGTVDEEIMTLSLRYFCITGLSYPFLALQQVSSAEFRAEGNSRLPMTVAAIANGVNIIGNAILIFGFGMGVVGAAISTLFSRFLACAVMLTCQKRTDSVIRMDSYRSIRPDLHVILLVLRIGIPSALESGMFQFGKIAVQSTVSYLGTVAMAAQAMTHMIDLVQSMPSTAVGLATLTVVGQCLGAGKVDEAKKYTRKLCFVAGILIICMASFLLALTRPITVISGMSTEAAELTFHLLCIITAMKCVFWVPSFTLPNALRASGDVVYTATAASVSMWVLRVAGSWILCRYLGFGLEGVWYAWFADWILRDICYIARYLSGAWQRKRVLKD